MITFLALLRLPAWVALSKAQRRYVWQLCVHPLLTREPVVVAKTVLLFAWILAACQFEAFGGFVPSFGTMFAAVFLIPESLDLWLVARHRQDITIYIQRHRSEIQSVA